MNTSQFCTIEKWSGGKKSATVLTFDDWSPGQGLIAVPMCIEKKVPATFFVMIDYFWSGGGYAQMNYAAENGLEIGNHSKTHPKLSTIDPSLLEEEINKTKLLIEEKVPSQGKVLTFCYPHGYFNQNVIDKTKEQHIAARTFEEEYKDEEKDFRYDFDQTKDGYYQIQEIRVNQQLSQSKYKEWIEHGIDQKALMVFTFHSIFNKEVDDHWYDDISEEHLSTFIDDVKSYQNNTWITTFANAVRYHKEAQCSAVSMIEENEVFIFLEVSNDLPLEPYNVPLTLRLDGINYVSIIQGNKELLMVVEGNSTLVDVIPNQGKIQIQKQK